MSTGNFSTLSVSGTSSLNGITGGSTNLSSLRLNGGIRGTTGSFAGQVDFNNIVNANQSLAVSNGLSVFLLSNWPNFHTLLK
jgi:hypothetical protein